MLFIPALLLGGANPGGEDPIAKGIRLLSEKHYRESAAAFKEQLAKDPLNGTALFNLGYLYGTFLGDEKLRDEYWNAYKASSHVSLGDIALDGGNVEEAAAHYRDAMDFIPDNPKLHERLGTLCLRMGQGQEALAEYKKAAELDPGNLELQTALARYLWQNGERGDAVACIERAVSARPDDIPLLRKALDLFRISGEKERTAEALHALSRSGAATPEEHCELGESYLEKGMLNEAAAEIRSGFSPQTKKSCVTAALALAAAYEKGDETQNAAEVYRALCASGAAPPEAYNALVLLAHRAGKIDAATAAAEKGVAAFPDSAELHNNLATLYALRNEYEKAVAEYRTTVKLKPGLAEAWLDMGIICKDYLKKPDDARAAFVKYAALRPEGATLPEVADILNAAPESAATPGTPAPGGESAEEDKGARPAEPEPAPELPLSLDSGPSIPREPIAGPPRSGKPWEPSR
jgi:tetratricopeptide (TPR) repeat protein